MRRNRKFVFAFMLVAVLAFAGACGNNQEPKPNDEVETTDTAQPEEQPAETDDNTATGDSNQESQAPAEDSITEDEAIQIALEKAGIAENADYTVDVDDDLDDNEYEVEIKFEGKEYEVNVDKTSGNINSYEEDN